MANAKPARSKLLALESSLTAYDAQDVHVSERGRGFGRQLEVVDKGPTDTDPGDGKPCVRGWFENEADARRAQSKLVDCGFKARVVRDGNGGREWFWVCAR